ncbi:MAG TPA: 3-methyl-2-oxobutanoate hydroxymethyltransferase [Usitatibacter sp.]|jgi:3-methyl-2-oxobutanoate hydroxymethyltransferase|nr:3-methyl-2-oxobutanoate hydroxymethyltransferase [Usitatibacter sp.]
MSAQGTDKNVRVSIPKLQERARAGEKLVMLTCYDSSFARISDDAGVDMLLIGDSLGMVVEGHDSTLPVTIEATEYHVRCVARGSDRALVIGDMPFGSFQESPAQAFHNAARLIAAGAQMVKLEGGAVMAETTKFLVDRGIPVCAHIGLTPQSVHTLGGYKVQGKQDAGAEKLMEDAKANETAGAAFVLMEAMPAALAKRVTESLSVPTIGIGAGPDVSGQVLVNYDMLDIYPGRKARFVKNFMQGAPSVKAAIEAYVKAVKAKTFPGPEHSF